MLYINGFDDIEATKYNYVCEYVICTRAPPPQRPLCCIILNQRQFEHGTTRVSFQKRKKKRKRTREMSSSPASIGKFWRESVKFAGRGSILVRVSIPLLNLPVESEQEETLPFPMINGRGRGAVSTSSMFERKRVST